ncbi:hypothetical protein niasHT_011962 [Heterodera trifolii]|uniref:Uncharacterized protein n=1 Tax=Heterodera trifolii TaxID=157864 RepID=A0ABD2LK48_9BILA
MNSSKPMDGIAKEKMLRFNDTVKIGEATADYDRKTLPNVEVVPLLAEQYKADAHNVMEMYMEDKKMTRMLLRFNQKCTL